MFCVTPHPPPSPRARFRPPLAGSRFQDNADKLDIPGADRKKMVEYRAQLDKERESALAKGRNRPKRKVRAATATAVAVVIVAGF